MRQIILFTAIANIGIELFEPTNQERRMIAARHGLLKIVGVTGNLCVSQHQANITVTAVKSVGLALGD